MVATTGSGHCAALDGDVVAAAALSTAADAGTTTVATGNVHRAAGDGDVVAAAVAAAADAGTHTVVKVATGSVHRAAGDGDVFAVGEGAADAGSTTTVATGSVHRAAGDGDVFADAAVTAADAGTTVVPVVATGGRHLAAVDGDVFAAAGAAAADAGTILVTGSVHCAAGDGDVFALAFSTAADAGTTAAAGSGHCAAGDGDVFAVAKVTAADAGTIKPTGGRQAAGFVIIVLQGQRACGGFFKARTLSAAFQFVIAVQLDLHIALSLNAQGSLSFLIPIILISGVAHIDLYVFQGEVQHLIGNVVDHRNGVAPKAIILFVHRSRACRGSSRGCLLVCTLLPVCAFRFLGDLRLVCIFRFLSALRLGRLVVVLYHRAKVGILCCGAFQVALQRGDDRIRGGDDGLLPGLVRPFISALFDGLAAILIFGDGNIAVVDVVGICKGRSRQRHRNTQRCYQSCCPAECVVLLHRGNLLSFLRFFVVFTLYNTSQNTQPCFRTLRGGWNCFLRILFQNLMLHTQQTTSKTQLSYRKTLHP